MLQACRRGALRSMGDTRNAHRELSYANDTLNGTLNSRWVQPQRTYHCVHVGSRAEGGPAALRGPALPTGPGFSPFHPGRIQGRQRRNTSGKGTSHQAQRHQGRRRKEPVAPLPREKKSSSDTLISKLRCSPRLRRCDGGAEPEAPGRGRRPRRSRVGGPHFLPPSCSMARRTCFAVSSNSFCLLVASFAWKRRTDS